MSQPNQPPNPHPATSAAPVPAPPGFPAPAGHPPTHPGRPTTPMPAPAGPRERRVRFGHLALAIALIVVGALGSTALVTLVAADGSYLALANDVDYGARISESDLIEVRISNPPGLNPVPAREFNRVVGNYATMPLAAGTLLTQAHVTNVPHPASGEVRLGITLRGDRLPAQPVRPGMLLLLVETGNDSGPVSEDRPALTSRTWEAIVVGVGGDGASSGLLSGNEQRSATLDVIVPARDAPVIAGLAAANDLSVAVLPGQPEG